MTQAQPRQKINNLNILPYAQEAEAGLIALAVSSAECLYKLEEAGITDKFFLGESARYLFGLLRKLTDEGEGTHPSDFNFVSHLRNLGTAGEAIYGYYRQVQTEPIATEWFDQYLKKLVNAFKKREYLQMAQELALMAYDDQIAADACTTFSLDRAEQIDRATNPLNILDGPKLFDLMTEFYRTAPNRPEGSSWGLKSLDSFIGGARLGELSILYAPPGFGKSALYQQACYHRAFVLGRPQLWITIGDMTATQVFNRWMQQEVGISSISLSRGNFTTPDGFDHKNKVKAQMVQMKKSPLFMYEDDTLASTDVRRIIKSLLRKLPTLDVYVDHIGQFTDKAENIYEKTTNIAAQLLRCAHNIRDESGQPQISLNVISPINKAGKYSGSMDLGHAPENIFTLEPLPPEKGGPDPNKSPSDQSGLVNFKIEKSRHGGRGAVPLFFQANQAKFTDISTFRV